MNYIKAACFDVYYYEDYAKACCIVFEIKPLERIVSEYCERTESVAEYIPGEFYKRELPCLLKVYENIKEDIDLVIVDGFVCLGNGKKGLGAYMFEVLDGKIPVVGVAKTFFKGCTDYIKIYRGESNRPLYISSLGIGLNDSAKLIRNLNGKNRIPDVLKKVDQLTRVDTEF